MTPADLENVATYLRSLTDMAADLNVYIERPVRLSIGDCWIEVGWDEDENCYVMVCA